MTSAQLAVVGDAETTAKNLSDSYITARSYYAPTTTQFAPCEYCDRVQGLAVLTWWWERDGYTTRGCADTCTNTTCTDAIRSIIWDEGGTDVTVEYPIYLAPNPGHLAAA